MGKMSPVGFCPIC